MKKYLSIIASLFILVPSISFASIDTNLAYGARGQAVIDLQNLLISKGFLNTQVTGGFYSLTRQAVIAYQMSLGLPTTGFVGPMTRAKINAEISSVLPVSVSSTTVAVSSIPVKVSTQQTTPTPEQQSVTNSLSQQIAQTQAVQNSNQNTTTPPPTTPQPEPVLTPAESMAVTNSIQTMRNLCVEHPTLTFQADRGTSTANANFLAIYTTTCIIDPNMTWSFSDGNSNDTQTGTLGSGLWRFGRANGSTVDNTAFYSFSGAYPGITSFTITVGTTTVTANTYR